MSPCDDPSAIRICGRSRSEGPCVATISSGASCVGCGQPIWPFRSTLQVMSRKRWRVETLGRKDR